jgi:hypothetical protein
MSHEEEMGSLGGGLRDPWDDEGNSGVIEGDALLDPLTGGDVQPQPPGRLPELPEPQPVNQATMECQRGPCVHLWTLVKRYETTVPGVRAACIRTCTASGYEDTPLGDQNIMFCDRWWPRKTYDQIPDDLDVPDKRDNAANDFDVVFCDAATRGMEREKLRTAWEELLERDGYDFSWRDFDPVTYFTQDDEHGRKFSGPGGRKAAEDALKENPVPPATTVPADEEEDDA